MGWWWPLDACDYWYLFIIAIVVLGFGIDWLAGLLADGLLAGVGAGGLATRRRA